MITQTKSNLPTPRVHHGTSHPGVEYTDDLPTQDEIAATKPDFVDVSHHQNDIDWDAYKNTGAKGAIIKVTEGGDWVDDHFAGYRKSLSDRGMKCGLYHFARPNGTDMNADATAEANNYLAQVGTLRANEFPVLDFEITNKLKPDQLGKWAEKFMSIVAERTGKDPWFYTYSNMLPKVDCTNITKYPLWLANYQSCDKDHPPSAAPWSSMVAWQYSEKGNVPGITGNVDTNYMYGGWPGDAPAQQPPAPQPPTP